MNQKKFVRFLISVVCAVVLASAAQAVPKYTITGLGGAGIVPYPLSALGINDLGQITGRGTTYSEWGPFVYTNGDLTALDGFTRETPLCPRTGYGTAINNLGIVVGQSYLYTHDTAAIWKNGKISPLGKFNSDGSCMLSCALAINDRCQAVGWTYVPSQDYTKRATLWQNGTTEYLYGPTNVPIADTTANGINNSGMIVGCYRVQLSGNLRACIWNKKQLITIDRLSDASDPFQGYSNIAYAINDRGQVVGESDIHLDPCINTVFHAFIWQNGVTKDLGALDAYPESRAYDINNLGQVVGAAEQDGGNDPPASVRALLWDKGTVYDLNDLIPADSGWILVEARAINDAGQIVGTGKDSDGNSRGFLLTPNVRPVLIDIKPEGCSNSINLRSNGLVEVAVLSLTGFNPAKIKPCTVSFAGAKVEDCHLADLNRDGTKDLVCTFRVKKLNLTRQSKEATLTAIMKDGTPIEGSDNVVCK